MKRRPWRMKPLHSISSLIIESMESKRPAKRGLFFVRLVAHRDVGSLGPLGPCSTLNSTFCPSVSYGNHRLDGGEMDENVLPPSRSIKPNLITIEPFTVPLIRQTCICLLWQFKIFFRICCSIGGQTKHPRIETVSCAVSSNQRNLRYPTKTIITD